MSEATPDVVSSNEDVAAARRIIDANRYMTLATADADGRPWATPVWFAHDGYTEFWWVSRPTRRHSRNLAVRPQTGIVIFDSTVPAGEGQGVYIEAVAEEAGQDELAHGIAIFSARSVVDNGQPWQEADVVAPARFRLYHARARETFVTSPTEDRMAVDLEQ